jgi:FKBP-type peptidyl-prolyl cis-trans isomerase 2
MKVENGKKVKVHYTGKYEDGEVFDSSKEREPIEFTVGEGQLIVGFEEAVIGMEVGETKTVNITPENGYGDVREDLFTEVEKSQLPEGVEVGSVLQAMTPTGPVAVKVTEMGDDKVVVDANHPLAGKTLVFDLELMEVV